MKLHELSERRRKIILWTIVIVLGIILFAWWARGLSEKLESIQKEGLGVELPEINTQIDFPEFLYIPDINADEENINENNETILEQNGEDQEGT